MGPDGRYRRMVRRLPRDPVRKGAVLVAFLAASSVYFVYTYLHAPRAERMEAQTTRLRRLEAHNAEGEDRAAEARLLEQRVSRYLAQLERLETIVPSDLEVSSLLESLSATQGGSGVRVTRMRPEPIQDGQFYDRWSYEMEIRGSYHAVASFLTDAASLERVLVPQVVAIVPAAAPPGDVGTHGHVTAHVRLTTYMPVATETASQDLRAYSDGSDPAGRLVLERERFAYPRYGRRDPFQPLAGSPADGATVTGLQVLGIIHHEIPHYSLVLLRTGGDPGIDPGPEALRPAQAATHRLRAGDTLGPLRIVRIRNRQVVVEVTDERGVTRRILEVPRPVRRSGT